MKMDPFQLKLQNTELFLSQKCDNKLTEKAGNWFLQLLLG